ncbi:MAG: hypothetical protein PCFJNLEI_00711 [Verrucomicrobiae bacterium]|nr:hypothetical protein [Verrucomicrobiae bacterium]
MGNSSSKFQTGSGDLQATLKQWMAILVGIVLAMVVGFFVGTESWRILMMGTGIIVACAIVISFGSRAWVLILLGWAFVGSTEILRLPFSLRDMTVMVAFVACITARILNHSGSFSWRHPLDVLLLVNFFWLGVTFLRFPVGFRALGTEMVGGRPYLNAAIAGCAYWVLRDSSQHPSLLARAPLFYLASNAAFTMFNIIAYLFPSLSVYLWFFNASVDLSMYNAEASGMAWYSVRLVGLKSLGLSLVYVLCAYYPPRTLFNPLRFRSYLFVGGLACIFLTGFRSDLLLAIAAIMVGTWLHSGWREVWGTMAIATVFFGVICFGQGRVYDLPAPVQRTLAWLPGRWSTKAIEEGRSSTASRIDWWLSIIHEGEIRNPLFGDGIGTSKEDLAWMARARSAREAFNITGGYHNGPLSTIKHFGVVGLMLLYAFMYAAAKHAVRAVQRLRGTKFQPLAILLATWLVWGPVQFTLIYGDDVGKLIELAFFCAFIRALLYLADEPRALHGNDYGGKPTLTRQRATAPA